MSNIQISTTKYERGIDVTKNIYVIIAEYSSLRSEILTRTSNMYQLFGAGFATLLWIFTNSYSYSTLIVFFVGVFFFLLFYWLIERDIRKAARRIREIEREVNNRTGEQLLIWESRWGGGVTGFFGTARPLTIEEADERANKEDELPWVGNMFISLARNLKSITIFFKDDLLFGTLIVVPIGIFIYIIIEELQRVFNFNNLFTFGSYSLLYLHKYSAEICT